MTSSHDRWSPEILQALDLDPERLATVKPSGVAVGPMRSALAQDLGLAKAPLVVTGGHDQACGALGVGLVRPGLAMVSTGTAEVVEVALDSPALNETLYRGNISVYAHTVAGLFLSMTLNHSGGLLLRWFRDTLGQEEMRRGRGCRSGCLRSAPAGCLAGANVAAAAAPLCRQRHAHLGHRFQGRHPGPDLCHGQDRPGQGHPGGPDL